MNNNVVQGSHSELGLPVGKVNSVIVSLVLLAFSTDRNDAFLPFHILELGKSLPVLYLKPKKGTPFARRLPI